jgi:hypothetical protein
VQHLAPASKRGSMGHAAQVERASTGLGRPLSSAYHRSYGPGSTPYFWPLAMSTSYVPVCGFP